MKHYTIKEHPIWEIWERLHTEKYHCKVDGKGIEIYFSSSNQTHKVIFIKDLKRDIMDTEVLLFYPDESKIKYIKLMSDESLILSKESASLFTREWEWVGNEYHNTTIESIMNKLCDILKDKKSRSEMSDCLKAKT